MGLGKTAEIIGSIALSHAFGDVGPTLVVCPASLVNQWNAEIQEFARPRSEKDIKFADYVRRSITVCSYGRVAKHKFKSWYRIVFDEGHQIRNPRSKTFVRCKDLSSDIRWVLTGTPIVNKEHDFNTLCSLIGIKPDVYLNNPQLVASTDGYMIRRTKEQLSGCCQRLALPPLFFENVELDMPDIETRSYIKSVNVMKGLISAKELAISDGNSAKEYNAQLLETLLRMRQICTWPPAFDKSYTHNSTLKLETLKADVEMHPGEKTLVFCQFHAEMDKISSLLRGIGWTTYIYSGKLNGEEKDEVIQTFKGANQSRQALIIQIKAGGVGLNIQVATRVYIMGPSWNPATELQAIGRSHRTGQTKNVYVRKYIYTSAGKNRTIEQAMMGIQSVKQCVCSRVLNDPRLIKSMPISKDMPSLDEILRELEL